MLCQSTFSWNASVNGSSIDTWTDRHAIICYFSAGLPLNWRIGTGLADWHRIGRLQPDWLQIGRLALDWPIGTGLADWHQIGQLAPDWIGLAQIGKLKNLCLKEKLAPNWHQIGMDWHGLAWIGTDWHGLARIG